LEKVYQLDKSLKGISCPSLSLSLCPPPTPSLCSTMSSVSWCCASPGPQYGLKPLELWVKVHLYSFKLSLKYLSHQWSLTQWPLSIVVPRLLIFLSLVFFFPMLAKTACAILNSSSKERCFCLAPDSALSAKHDVEDLF
jgi:hypothetical protein